MARDRLAAMREQQRQGQDAYSSAPAPSRAGTGAPSYGGSYGQQAGSYPSRGDSYGQPPAQRQQPSYNQPPPRQGTMPSQPMQSHPPPPGAYQPNGPTAAPQQDETGEFFSRIQEIQSATRDLNAQIDRIHDLHQRQLAAAVNEEEHARVTQALTAEQDRTRQLSNSLKQEIKRLEAQTAKRPPNDPDTNVRRTQVGAVKNRFMEAIQKYQQVEQDSRKRQQARMERQYKIVKPDATQDEIRAAVADSSGSGGQVFAQALRDSNRYGEARSAYREVSERHRDIQNIERTLTELAQMFNDMALMVEEQDPMIQTIEAKANEAEVDTGHAEQQLQKAVKSARAARRKRWICFIIFLIIAIIVAVVVAVEVTKNKCRVIDCCGGTTSSLCGQSDTSSASATATRLM